MLTQAQAHRLISLLKEAALKEVFVWQENSAQTELFVAIKDERIQFKLSMKRNPFEIRLHLRTRDRDIGLVRLDAAPFHTNPDGVELRNQPHLHVYREGFGLDFADPVDWHDPANPVATIDRFPRRDSRTISLRLRIGATVAICPSSPNRISLANTLNGCVNV